MPDLFDTGKAAVISECGLYRYVLTRGADPCGGDVVNFLMLNPSTADAEKSDPTMTRCQGFARSWGYGDMVITNLFAYRSPDPAALRSAADPVGPENDRHILEAARRSSTVVAAWGAHPFAAGRALAVLRMLADAGIRPHHLGLTRDGHPRHPLYLRSDVRPIPW